MQSSRASFVTWWWWLLLLWILCPVVESHLDRKSLFELYIKNRQSIKRGFWGEAKSFHLYYGRKFTEDELQIRERELRSLLCEMLYPYHRMKKSKMEHFLLYREKYNQSSQSLDFPKLLFIWYYCRFCFTKPRVYVNGDETCQTNCQKDFIQDLQLNILLRYKPSKMVRANQFGCEFNPFSNLAETTIDTFLQIKAKLTLWQYLYLAKPDNLIDPLDYQCLETFAKIKEFDYYDKLLSYYKLRGNWLNRNWKRIGSTLGIISIIGIIACSLYFFVFHGTPQLFGNSSASESQTKKSQFSPFAMEKLPGHPEDYWPVVVVFSLAVLLFGIYAWFKWKSRMAQEAPKEKSTSKNTMALKSAKPEPCSKTIKKRSKPVCSVEPEESLKGCRLSLIKFNPLSVAPSSKNHQLQQKHVEIQKRNQSLFKLVK